MIPWPVTGTVREIDNVISPVAPDHRRTVSLILTGAIPAPHALDSHTRESFTVVIEHLRVTVPQVCIPRWSDVDHTRINHGRNHNTMVTPRASPHGQPMVNRPVHGRASGGGRRRCCC